MSDRATILVTGASGFIATHCILKLLEKGYAVRGTVRSLARGPAIQALLAQHGHPDAAISFAAAELTNDAGWAEAAAGCAGVLHVASPIPLRTPKTDDELVVPARDGALRVLKAAKAAGVKRVVLTSSTAACFYGHANRDGDTFTEADWTDPTAKKTSPYVRSKAIAERAAWDWLKAEGGGLELATVLPGIVLGPALEKDFGSSLEVVRQLMTGAMPGTPRLGWPVVDVRDVADMHVRALETPAAAGERFLCAGDFMWMNEMAQALRRRFPERRKIPSRNLPSWLVRFLAMFDPAIRSVVFEIEAEKRVSHDKATRILGWRPRSGVEATVAAGESLVKYGIV